MLIGEVSQRSGVSVRMLRHYDRIGLVRPSGRTSTGYRRYEPEDLRRLFRVEALRALGLSLEQARRALDDPGFDAAQMLAGLIDRTVRRIAAERELLARVREIQSTGPRNWSDALGAVELLSALRSGGAAERQAAALRSGTVAASLSDSLVGIYLSEPDAVVAGSLRWAIARAGDAAVPALAAHLSDATSEVRRRAVLALGEIDGSEAAEALATGLEDADAGIAGLAAIRLATRKDVVSRTSLPAICAPLVELIVAGDGDVEAAEALGALASRSQTEADRIAGMLGERIGVTGPAARRDDAAAVGSGRPTTADPAVRSRLAQALGEIPGDAAAEILRALVTDPDPEVSRIARYLLGGRRADSDGPGGM
jgi:DNA-binding transcriptional MerR regulator